MREKRMINLEDVICVIFEELDLRGWSLCGMEMGILVVAWLRLSTWFILIRLGLDSFDVCHDF
jgi:hypothetical protein